MAITARTRRLQAERLEDATADLLQQADRWTVGGRSIYDIRVDRRNLLRSARLYADALRKVNR